MIPTLSLVPALKKNDLPPKLTTVVHLVEDMPGGGVLKSEDLQRSHCWATHHLLRGDLN